MPAAAATFCADIHELPRTDTPLSASEPTTLQGDCATLSWSRCWAPFLSLGLSLLFLSAVVVFLSFQDLQHRFEDRAKVEEEPEKFLLEDGKAGPWHSVVYSVPRPPPPSELPLSPSSPAGAERGLVCLPRALG